jgi:7,8-dihydropterin-6-yl-methyl-4-(beta-D-ribofuranosyl)aminobenzene 5'-phosphate synthase
LKSGTIIPVAKVPLPTELQDHGAVVVNDRAARLLLDGHFYYGGEIPRVTP